LVLRFEVNAESRKLKPNLLKGAVRQVLTIGFVNRLAVPLILALPDFDWRQRIPVVGRIAVLELHEGASVRMGHTDRCQVAQELFWNRGRLRSDCDRLALETALAFARNADVFLDIGAYSGLFSLAAARVNPSLLAYAYEILPQNFLTLYDNILLNNLVSRIVPRLCGLSNEAGVMKLPTSRSRGVLPSSIAIDWNFSEGVDVPIRTLDECHANSNGSVTIKIDVEGFEAEVLEGGRNLLEHARPDIICEVLRRAKRISDMEELLQSLDYRFYHITDRGLVESQSVAPKKRERDWLFTIRDATELRDLGLPVASKA
jgi:FkbM family methyltransferase